MFKVLPMIVIPPVLRLMPAAAAAVEADTGSAGDEGWAGGDDCLFHIGGLVKQAPGQSKYMISRVPLRASL